MPILNFRSYGEGVFGWRWPFTEADVEEELEILALVKKEKDRRQRNAPKTVEFKTGQDFITFCENYNQKRGRLWNPKEN